jgi:hypothetical protein
MYKDAASTYGDASTQGATIAFNICESDGTWIGSSEVGRQALLRNTHIRTGSLCNPAGMAFALDIGPAELKKIYDTGFRCGQEGDVINNKPLGMVRVSFGAMSAMRDVEVFLRFVEKNFVNQDTRLTVSSTKGARMKSPASGQANEGKGSTRFENDTNLNVPSCTRVNWNLKRRWKLKWSSRR